MTIPELPGWLAEAIAARAIPSRLGLDEPEMPTSTPPQAHEIRRLESMDPGGAPSRLVLVTRVDPSQAVATVVLLSPDVESTSDVDRMLSTQLTGLPFALTAMTDVSGPAWFVQLGPALAVLECTLFDLPVAGLALRDELDSRWAWKETELDALIALTAECRFQLLDGEPTAVADPLAFDPSLVDLATSGRMTREVVEMLEHRALLLPAEALSSANVDPTSRTHVVTEPLLQAISHHSDLLLAMTPDAVQPQVILRSRAHDPLPRVLLRAAGRFDELTRSISIKTVSSLWDADLSATSECYMEVFLAGRRHQLVVEAVDLREGHLV